MKLLFIIQGEGRGHMTQAIALQELLLQSGHHVAAALVGKSQRRTLPEFVQKKLKTELHQFESPNFITDNKEKSIHIGRTVWCNISKLDQFRKSLDLIHTVVKKHRPDVIINFYDILGGFYHALYRPKAQFWAIGHQYLIYHPDFPFAPGAPLQRKLFQFNTYLTAMGADRLLALSFRELGPHRHPKLTVLPPLLRAEVKMLIPTPGDFLLAYMVNPGYAGELITYAEKHPEAHIEAFWDKKDMPSPYCPLPNLIFHQINDILFLEKMAQCKGLISTAGFESICEAMSLGKKVLMVPVAGQYEQACNALDAEKSGAGIVAQTFDVAGFNAFLDGIGPHTFDPAFRDWTLQLEKKLSDLFFETQKSSPPYRSRPQQLSAG